MRKKVQFRLCCGAVNDLDSEEGVLEGVLSLFQDSEEGVLSLVQDSEEGVPSLSGRVPCLYFPAYVFVLPISTDYSCRSGVLPLFPVPAKGRGQSARNNGRLFKISARPIQTDV